MSRWSCLIICVVLTSCSATVDKEAVRATEGAPVSAQVEVLQIPYNSSLPRYIVTVEPLQIGTGGGASEPVPSGQRSRSGWGPWGLGPIPGPDATAPAAYSPGGAGMSDRVSMGIAAQLVNALGNVGNIVVIDYEHYLSKRTNPASLRRSGEVGPFVIKGTVTEFNEVAEATAERKGGSLGWTGTVLGVAGAVAGVPAAAATGAGVAAANPTFENTKAQRTGSVAFDLQIVEPGSGRLYGTCVASGKFTAQSATSGVSVFGIGGGASAFAASALGQATRAAVNDASRQIMTRLSATR